MTRLIALFAVATLGIGALTSSPPARAEGAGCQASTNAGMKMDLAGLCRIDWRPVSQLAANPPPAYEPPPVQLAAAPGREAPSKWRFEAMIYAAIPVQVRGTSTTSGLTTPLDINLKNIFEELGVFAIAGRAEAWYEPWNLGFILDGQYVQLGQRLSVSVPPNLKADIRQGIIDFAVSYKFARIPLGPEVPGPVKGRRPEISFEAIAGLRYGVIRQEITPGGPGGITLGDTQSYVEPLFGGRIIWTINETSAVHLRGDASGFGIGGGSDLTWQIVAFYDYRFTKNHSAQIGVKVYDIDYDSGSGRNRFGMSVRMPMIWLSYTYHFTSF